MKHRAYIRQVNNGYIVEMNNGLGKERTAACNTFKELCKELKDHFE